MTKPLEQTFTKKGAKFTQVGKSEFGYIYRVELAGATHFEVFKHKEVNLYDYTTREVLEDKKVSYPKDESFGVWAWCVNSLETAKTMFVSLQKTETDLSPLKIQDN